MIVREFENQSSIWSVNTMLLLPVLIGPLISVKPVLTAALFATFMTGALSESAVAQTTGANLSMSQEALFEEKVRQTLLKRPEIMLEVFEILERRQSEEKTAQDATLIEKYNDRLFADLAEDKPVLLEFLDYRCGYCAKAHVEVLGLKAAHPEIEVVTLQFPILGEESKNMARWMLALRGMYGQDAFERIQTDIMTGDRLARADLLAFLEQKGFNAKKIDTAAKDDAITNELERVYALARGLGISGTPGFITRTKILRGFSEETVLIDAALEFLS